MSDTATAPERQAMARAGESYRTMAGLARRTVQEAHRCGRLLQTAKGELPHGGWLPALSAEGIPVRTAQRCMTLAERYPEIRQLDAFGSVDEALIDDRDVHVSHNSGESEWYTPPAIVEAVREALGGITLDPASSAKAQETVRAEMFYTAEDDGLAQPWYGRVFLNPPYAQPAVGQFVDKLLSSPGVDQWVALLNNATDTKWARSILEAADAVCFPSGRVRFLDADGDPKGAPLQGQMLCYCGPDAECFGRVTSPLGVVLWARS